MCSEEMSRSRREFWTVIAGMMLILALAALDQNIVSTALPRIVGDLGGLSHLSWVVTAFILTSTATTPLYGKLSDMYGRRAMFFLAVTIFLAGSALCGLSQSLGALIAFRAIQGVGAGGLLPLVQTAVADLVGPRERGRYQGLFVAVFSVCSVAGPVLGGVITDWLSWRWIFYVNIPVGTIALALIAAGFRRPARKVAHRVDYAGAALLTLATTAMLLALSWGGTVFPWGSPQVAGLAGGAVVLLVLLVGRERVADEPVLPPHLFGNTVFRLSAAVMTLNAVAMFGTIIFMPLFFQLVMGESATRAGLLISPLMAGVLVASILGGHLVSRTGRYKALPVLGMAASAGAFLGLAWLTENADGVQGIEVCLIALGFGLGLSMPTLTVAIQNAVDPRDLGVATSAAIFFRSLGSAVGVALSGAIVAVHLHGAGLSTVANQAIESIANLPPGDRTAIIDAYRHAIGTSLFVGSVVAAAAFLIATAIPERPLRSGAAGVSGLLPDD